MKISLKHQDIDKSWDCRNVTPQDIELLGELMLSAYLGTIDYEGETLQETIAEVQKTLQGGYGPFLAFCSFIIEREKRAISASLITYFPKFSTPLLAFSMTHPDFKNQGMATFLIRKSINTLLSLGYDELSLVVSVENSPARYIYEKMGFQAVENQKQE